MTANDRDGTGAGPTLSVTIVNHNARPLLEACLESLRRHPYTLGPMEIVVVDNASEDGSVEMLRADHPHVVLLAERQRRGFGANQNRAVAASSGEVLFMLNPDALVHPHTLDRLVRALVESGAAAAGGPTMNADGSARQADFFSFPTPWGPFAKALGLGRLREVWRRRAPGSETGWPSGGASLVRREVFELLGGFDESFFMYGEDADLFMRLRAAGYRIVWVSEAGVTHPIPDDDADVSRHRETEMVRGQIRYIEKHFGGGAASVYRGGLVLDAALRVALFSVPGLASLGRHHGKSTAQIRQARAARLDSLLHLSERAGLAEAAREWNLRHGVGVEAPPDDGRRRLDKLVVFDSGTTWDAPWMAFQHISLRLTQRVPVLFVDVPRSPVNAFRGRREVFLRSRLVQIALQLYRLTPLAPPGLTRTGIHHLTSLMARRAVRRAVRRLDAEVAAIFSSLSHANLLTAVPAATRVYYVSDDFEAGAHLMGRPPGRLARLDRELAESADTVVAISEELAERYRRRGHHTVFIPNGVDVDAFAGVDEAPPPPDVDLPEPIAGFVGQIGDRIDLSLLEAVVDAGLSLLLVGPRQSSFSQDRHLEQILARPNVRWVGAKAFAELPSYLRMMDVGLLAYTDSAFNRASFPLKTLEYLAAGRPVVATPLPAITWLGTDLVVTAAAAGEFAAAAVAASRLPRLPEVVESRRRFAATHSWDRRVDQIVEVLRLDG